MACSSSARLAIASQIVDRFISNGNKVGIGSGPLVYSIVEELGARRGKGQLDVVMCPSCNAAASSGAFHGVPMTTLEQAGGLLDIFIEEADQMDVKQNAFVKGVEQQPQQPNILAIRSLVNNSKRILAIVNTKCVVERLKGSFPVLIEGEEWEEPAEELDDLFLGDAELWRRSLDQDPNPRGGSNPYLTPEGHHIIDIKYEDGGSFKLFGEEEPYGRLLEEIESIPGTITSGLFVGLAHDAVVVEGSSADFISLR